MHSIHRKNVEDVFEHLNECTQTTLDEHDFIIYNEKDSHDMK